jgi:hypothetical protein
MDRSRRSFSQFDAAMRDSRACPFKLVLPTLRGFIRRHIFHEFDRRGIHKVTILWESQDGCVPEKSGIYSQPQTSSEAHARDGNRGDLPRSQHQSAMLGTCGVSISSAGFRGRAAKSGLGNGHHLHSFGQRFCISGGSYGLVLPLRHFLEGIEQPRDIFLFGSSRRGVGEGNSRYIQYRPRLPVYERRFHWEIETTQGQDQHGFSRSSFRQYFCRKTLANRQVRGYLSQRLSDNARRSWRAEELFSILQQRSISPIAGIPDARGSLSPQIMRQEMRLKLSTGQEV